MVLGTADGPIDGSTDGSLLRENLVSKLGTELEIELGLSEEDEELGSNDNKSPDLELGPVLEDELGFKLGTEL